MTEASPCAYCGHERFDHKPVVDRLPGLAMGLGGQVHYPYRYGACTHTRVEYAQLTFVCGCPGYAPDPHPLVSKLLGFDAKRDIERGSGEVLILLLLLLG